MKKAALLSLLTLAPLCAQVLNQQQRDFAMSQLHASRKLFLDAIAGLSQAQWKFKPTPDRWSIAECAEHVALSEDNMFERAQAALQSPAVPGRNVEAARDAKLLESMIDRSRKFKNSRQTEPTGRWAVPAQLAAYFREHRDRTIDYVRTTRDELRAHLTGSAPEAPDAYQMLLLIAAHTERHVAQINEVKADPRFPKR